MSNRLPETELANWSFIPANAKREKLERYLRPKAIFGSYEPYRKIFPDVVNQQFPLFKDGLTETSWSEIERRLAVECGGDKRKLRMNRSVLQATHKYCKSHGVVAMGIDVLPLSFGGALKYNFGFNLVFRYPGRSVIAFCDLRRSNGLTEHGMRFVFSAMHHRYREAYPDLANAESEIWRFGKKTHRELTPVREYGELITYESLLADIQETHDILNEIRRGGEDRRRAANGGAGPLFGQQF